MTAYLERSSNKLSISNFYEEYILNKYNMNPPYQRKSVWSQEKKSFFINSILNNLPVPPVFLKQNLDPITGRTSYDVIDGKQRLSSIIEFIGNEFPAIGEGDLFDDMAVSGKFFSEFIGPILEEFKTRFWRYQISIEYIDTTDPSIIDNIFDRLNRNGEPLEGQELRHSQYHSSGFLQTCYELAETDFWSERLSHTDKARMEDVEFISELLFVLLEGKPLDATDSVLDGYYEKYASSLDVEALRSLKDQFLDVTSIMQSLDIKYEVHKVYGVSHLYGLWCFSIKLKAKGIDGSSVSHLINKFYSELRSKNITSELVDSYKESMSNRTKSATQRYKRANSLERYCLNL